MIAKSIATISHWLNQSSVQSANGAERRRHNRIAVRHFPSAWVCSLNGSEKLGQVLDLGLGGFKLTSAAPIATAKPVALQLQIPLGADYTSTISLTARGAWSHYDAANDTFEAGFCYIDLTPAARQRLEQIIDVLEQRWRVLPPSNESDFLLAQADFVD